MPTGIYKKTKEHGRKISDTLKRKGIKPPSTKGTVLSEEHKRKLSEAHKGKMPKNIELFRKKGSLACIGRTPWNKGKSTSLEIREKQNKAKLGKPSPKKGKRYSDCNTKRKHIFKDIKDAVFKKYNGRCAFCGSKKILSIDHIYPISRGGTDDLDNLQLLCKKCNSTKHNKTFLSFREAVWGHKYLFYHTFCKKITDGDTIIVDIDLGFRLWIRDARLRLARINTPEIRTRDKEEKKQGLKAKKFLTDLIKGKQIIIETIKMPKDKQPIDSFGRYLVEIYDIDGNNINDLLAKNGYAIYKDY